MASAPPSVPGDLDRGEHTADSRISSGDVRSEGSHTPTEESEPQPDSGQGRQRAHSYIESLQEQTAQRKSSSNVSLETDTMSRNLTSESVGWVDETVTVDGTRIRRIRKDTTDSSQSAVDDLLDVPPTLLAPKHDGIPARSRSTKSRATVSEVLRGGGLAYIRGLHVLGILS
jgi:hypothetical protein